ncbi:MAG: hypothetical protein KQJ78_25245 [Deltaproteobacteria bacterium]|nr:hypothetical protein [Deltaproteobacteria bacterium]
MALGTGHTANDRKARFFFAVRCLDDAYAEVFLLDENDKLKPTGFREILPLDEVASLQYLAKFQPVYQNLEPTLGKRATSPKPAPKKPKVQPAPVDFDGIAASRAEPAAESAPAAAPAPATPVKMDKAKIDKMGWWELTSPGSGALVNKYDKA